MSEKPATAAAQPLATLLFTAAMQKNLSAGELAQATGYSILCAKHGFDTTTVGYWLHDGRLPKPKTAARLATALNVDFAQLASIIVWSRFKGEGV